LLHCEAYICFCCMLESILTQGEMHVDRNDESQLDHVKDEFSLLRESAYWQYLPKATQKGISALLDGKEWTRNSKTLQFWNRMSPIQNNCSAFLDCRISSYGGT